MVQSPNGPSSRPAECAFCQIALGRAPAVVVSEDDDTLAFVDLRQANPGHTLIIPRAHVADLRELDTDLGAKLMAMVIRITRAVDSAFPSDGCSIWHSIGPAAFQEVPHLHFHVHPRRAQDGLLRVYPDLPADTDESTRRAIGDRIRNFL